MVKIIDKKSTGKTGRLMLLAKETNGLVVCKNPIPHKQKAFDYGLVGFDFISYFDYIENRHLYKDRDIFIDEVSDFLTYACGPNVKGYTESCD